MDNDDLPPEALDFDDYVEFEELDDQPLDAEIALLAARVRAARSAGA